MKREVKETMNHAVAAENAAAELLDNLGVPGYNIEDIVYSGDMIVGRTIEADRQRRQYEGIRARRPLNQMISYRKELERGKARYLELQEKARLKGKEYKSPCGVDFYDKEMHTVDGFIAADKKALSERKKK